MSISGPVRPGLEAETCAHRGTSDSLRAAGDGTGRQMRRPASPTPEKKQEALLLKKAGNDLFDDRDFEGAVEQYSNAIKAAPSATLYSNRAAAHMMLGWWDQAARDIRLALKREPENERALERQAKILIARDELDDALRVLSELEQKIPEAERGKQVGLPASVRRLTWLAQAARSPGNLEHCRSIFLAFGSRAEALSPLGFRLRLALAKALVEASDAVENQHRIRPAVPKNKRTEEDGEEVEDLYPHAEEALEVTAKLLQDGYSEVADVKFWRSRALVRLGRQPEDGDGPSPAQADETEVVTQHQETKVLMEKLSEIEQLKAKADGIYKEGNLKEATHFYTLALEKDPQCEDTRTCASLYYNRSSAHRRLGEFELALEDANMALVLHPKWCKALYRRGILLLELGRFAEALTELKVVQRADPTIDEDLEQWLRRAHHWLSKPKGEVNLYHFMKLPMDATKDEIRKQYHQLCLLWHPDKNGGTEEGRQRFEELQQAYRFLTDDERRDRYDFGIWKDRTVRHHTKKREKVKDSIDETANANELEMPHWYHDCLLDDKVESVFWGDQGPPAWLQTKRRQHQQQQEQRRLREARTLAS